jgi:hypothetical protein
MLAFLLYIFLTFNQSWALPIQVSIFRYSILIGYRKKYRNIGLPKYRNIVYRIAKFHSRYSDTVSNKEKSIGPKKYRRVSKAARKYAISEFFVRAHIAGRLNPDLNPEARG